MYKLIIKPVFIRMTLIVAIVFCGLPAFSADFEKGEHAYERGDYETALNEWLPLAEQGLAEAQYSLGLLYYNGAGVPQDYAEAVLWYRKAAKNRMEDERGIPHAQYNLGLMYYYGEGVPQDYTETVNWYRKAADQGFAEGQYNLGLMYLKGEGLPQDYVEAVMWWRKAAEQGFAHAQYNLGLMYGKGTGVPQDNVLGYMWINLSATQGNKEAQNVRDKLAKKLASSQLTEAQKLATKCFAANYKNC